MPYKVNATLTCAHCGYTVEVVPEHGIGLSDLIAAANRLGGTWQRVEGDHVLCAECASSYRNLVSRHQRELREFFN